jgi:2-iminobutanoate/2-iminopropanoate deaminase
MHANLWSTGMSSRASRGRITASTDDAPAPVGPYSQSARIGRLVATAGQGAHDPRSGALAGSDIESQTRRCLANVEAALRASGATLDDVIRVGVFLANKHDYAGMNAIYEQVFGSDPPARTTVYVGLLPDDLLVEIDALAVLPDEPPGS